MHTFRLTDQVTVLNDQLEVPGIGFLPINAFVLHAREPVVIDTGVGLPDRDFVATLSSVIDPATVRWIFLTHPDRDHTGGLFALLEAAPNASLVTTFLGVGIMSTDRPVPLDRVYLLNPGQRLDVGDRTLHAFRPPLFDNPATVGLYDERSKICFTSDCFGAPLATAELAAGIDARQIPPADLHAAQLLWPAPRRSLWDRSCSACWPTHRGLTRSSARTSRRCVRCLPHSTRRRRRSEDQQVSSTDGEGVQDDGCPRGRRIVLAEDLDADGV
jgi:glyoxylase-like metal-dependent hydrolase (beta-lactamase superfamily II)